MKLSSPHLRELVIEDFESGEGRQTLECVVPMPMPRLRHLSLGGIGIAFTSADSLSRLRSLTVRLVCSLPELLHLLQPCGNLLTLETYGDHMETTSDCGTFLDQEYPAVTLPLLETLVIGRLHFPYAHWLIQHLDIPRWTSLSLSCYVNQPDNLNDYALHSLGPFIQRLGSVVRASSATSTTTVTIGRDKIICEIAGRRMQLVFRSLADHPHWKEGAWRTMVRRLLFGSGLGARPIYLSFSYDFGAADIRTVLNDWSLSVTEVRIEGARPVQAHAMLAALAWTESYAMLGEPGKVAWMFPNAHSIVFDRCPVDGKVLLGVVRARSERFATAAHIVEPAPFDSLRFFEVTGLTPSVLNEIRAIVPEVIVVES